MMILEDPVFFSVGRPGLIYILLGKTAKVAVCEMGGEMMTL